MCVNDLLTENRFAIVNKADFERDCTSIYCCDLLSIAMGRAPADSVWITVMGNANAAAVAVLADISCIILAEGIEPDAVMLQKAISEGVNVLKTTLPIFETAMAVNALKN